LFPLGVPASLDDALRFDDPQKQLQLHTGGPAFSSNQGAIFHGHGGGVDESKDRILRYCREIDAGLRPLLKNETAPLVLASVDYLVPLYKEANTYAHLLNESISGNPESLSADQLQERAWTLVEPQFQKAQNEANAKYAQLQGTGRTSNRVGKVIGAAANGRVEILFVAVGQQRWGTMDSQSDTVEVHGDMQPGDEDLLDRAAIETLLNGGVVFAVDPSKVPGDAGLAAIYRY
jgi:hypothetical protein